MFLSRVSYCSNLNPTSPVLLAINSGATQLRQRNNDKTSVPNVRIKRVCQRVDDTITIKLEMVKASWGCCNWLNSCTPLWAGVNDAMLKVKGCWIFAESHHAVWGRLTFASADWFPPPTKESVLIWPVDLQESVTFLQNRSGQNTYTRAEFNFMAWRDRSGMRVLPTENEEAFLPTPPISFFERRREADRGWVGGTAVGGVRLGLMCVVLTFLGLMQLVSHCGAVAKLKK